MSYVNTRNPIYLQTSHLEICLPKPVHCWPLNYHLVTQCLLAYLDCVACLAFSCPWDMYKYCSVLWNIVNKNYLYMAPLYNFLHGKTAIENFVVSIVTGQCCIKQWLTICIPILCCTGSVLDKKSQNYVLAEEKFDDIGTWLTANPKRSYLFASSMWVGKT